MKIILVLVLLAHLSCETNKNKIKDDCILLEVKKGAHCGIFSVWVSMKFKNKNDNEIFIGFVNCPEMYGNDFFVAGRVYKLIGEKPFIKPPEGIVHDEYSNSAFPTFRIDNIKLK